MAFQGLFVRTTIPSRHFASLASKKHPQILHNAMLPPPSQLRHFKTKPKLGGNWGAVIGIGAAAGFTLAMLNITYQKRQAEKNILVSCKFH